MSRWLYLAAFLIVPLAGTLSACQTTQETSKIREARAQEVVSEGALKVEQPSKEVEVLDSVVLSDEFGDAVVVELENTSKDTLVNVPILIDVRDKAGKSIFKNDTAGLEPSLNHISVLRPGERTAWVNDQILASGKPASVKVTVGEPEGEAPGQVPELEVSAPSLHEDSSGIQVEGKVVNKSQIDQIELILYAVARSGGKVVAGGRGQIKALKIGARPGAYNIFFIGNPRGAEIEINAPPTVFE